MNNPDKQRGNLAARLITAGVAAPVILGLIYLAPAWAWFGLVLLGALGASVELVAMASPDDRVGRWVAPALTALVSSALFWGQEDSRLLPTAVLICPIVALGAGLLSPKSIGTSGLRMTAWLATPFYVSMLTSVALVRRDSPDDVGAGFALLTLMIAWMADTGGYFAGRAFGRTKLYELVSPKKTREGALGGIVGSVAGGLLAHFWYLPSLPLLDALLLCVVGSVLSQVGDLAESLLKRSWSVKDSGTLLPGHGGVLDRIDGLLFVAPLVYLYTLWQNPLGL